MSRDYIILTALVFTIIVIGIFLTMKYLEYLEYQASHNAAKVVMPSTFPLTPLSPELRAEIRVLNALRVAHQASSTPIATSTAMSQQKTLDAARKKAAQNKATTLSPKVQKQQLLDLDALRAQAQASMPVSN